MEDSERERLAEHSLGESGDRAGAAESVADSGAESFLNLEAALSSEEGPQDRTYGLVVDAGRVDASAVPPDYPREITTREALALEIEPEPDLRTVTAFFEWGGDDDRMTNLLAAAGLSYDTFAELHGTRLLLEPDGEYLVPVVPPREPRGNETGYYGVLGGLAFNLLTVLVLFVAPGLLWSLAFILVFLMVNLLVIPGATYLDAAVLETRTDWDHAPSFWAVFSAVPLLNVAVSLAYLGTRNAAKPLAG